MRRSTFLEIWGPYLDILCCPDCKGKDANLIYESKGSIEYLHCNNCKKRFDVVNAVPILFSSDYFTGEELNQRDKERKLDVSPITQEKNMSLYDDWKYLSYQYYTRYREFLESIKDFSGDGTVLDIGCAGGSLAANFKSYIGLDVSWKLISFARSYLDKPFVLADAQNMPFKTKSVAHFISRNMLEHTKNDRQIIREVSRICSKRGVFELPCSDGISMLMDPVNVVRSKIGSAPMPIFSYGFGHINMQTEGEWKQRLTENNFVVSSKRDLGRGIFYKLFSLVEFILFSSGDNDDIPARYVRKNYFRFIHPVYNFIYNLDPKTNKAWSKVFCVEPKLSQERK